MFNCCEWRQWRSYQIHICTDGDNSDILAYLCYTCLFSMNGMFIESCAIRYKSLSSDVCMKIGFLMYCFFIICARETLNAWLLVLFLFDFFHQLRTSLKYTPRHPFLINGKFGMTVISFCSCSRSAWNRRMCGVGCRCVRNDNGAHHGNSTTHWWLHARWTGLKFLFVV